MSLDQYDHRSWFQRIEDQVSGLEKEVAALKEPSGGHYQEAIREFLEGNLSTEQRLRKEAEAKLAEVTLQRDEARNQRDQAAMGMIDEAQVTLFGMGLEEVRALATWRDEHDLGERALHYVKMKHELAQVTKERDTAFEAVAVYQKVAKARGGKA